jgi:hypothetical protein
MLPWIFHIFLDVKLDIIPVHKIKGQLYVLIDAKELQVNQGDSSAMIAKEELRRGYALQPTGFVQVKHETLVKNYTRYYCFRGILYP